jgi:hypothetical protein
LLARHVLSLRGHIRSILRTGENGKFLLEKQI